MEIKLIKWEMVKHRVGTYGADYFSTPTELLNGFEEYRDTYLANGKLLVNNSSEWFDERLELNFMIFVEF